MMSIKMTEMFLFIPAKQQWGVGVGVAGGGE